jgi:hypothetical protein
LEQEPLSVSTRSTVIPTLAKKLWARVRKAVAVSLRSSLSASL